MSKNFVIFRIAVGLLCLTGLTANAQSVSISEGGSPSYSMAVSVPPGIAGMAPNVGLIYSGGGVNGPVGYGWSIQGISTITRCANTRAIDGNTKGVAYTSDDKLCLDGQRLIQTDANGVVAASQTSDSLGGTGLVREYRTEKDSYARIRAYGSAVAGAAAGPAYFVVWTKSGQIYEYGNNANSTASAAITIPAGDPKAGVVTAWAASRISDGQGNYIDFQYLQRDTPWGSGTTAGSPRAGHEWGLSEIRYTGTPAQTPVNRVSFVYEDRPVAAAGLRQDRQEAYHLGSKNVSVLRLTKIQTYINVTATPVKVKTVRLAYENGAITNRSRVKTITECNGAETACLPATTFNYQSGGDDSYVASPNFNLMAPSAGIPPLLGGTSGVLTGDFNGDGKTDLLIWSDTPANNQLWLSNGDGSFTQNTNFNVTTTNLNHSNGCFYSVVTDLNGDGILDILRVARTVTPSGAACASNPSLLFLGTGNGTTFSAPITLPSNIDLTQIAEVRTSGATSCVLAQAPKRILLASADSGLDILRETMKVAALANAATCYNQYKTTGKNFFILDVNGDGIQDIVTTINPGYSALYSLGDVVPTPAQACASVVCTHVYLGSSTGVFTEALATNLAHQSVYSDPPSSKVVNYPRPPSVADANGDGLMDIFAKTGTWISRGSINGDFDPASASACANAIDFNGDGRSDCLVAYGTVANQALYIGDGTLLLGATTTNFNLNVAGTELFGFISGTTTQNIGNVVLDVNGDGRHDILRWEDDPTKNVVYLSNGDGTFTASTTFNLNTAARQLKKSDGTFDFVTGDFTGRGNTEFLRFKYSPVAGNEATTNQLYVKVDSSQPDLLISAVSPTGLTTTLTWVPLSNSASGSLGQRYTSDRGTTNKAVAPKIDVTAPIYVVATSTTDSGVGTGASATVATEFFYAGLKAAFDGRGLQGFRETRRQSYGPNGQPLSVATQYLQDYPYIGVAVKSETWNAALNSTAPQVLSRSTYTYCDKTAAAGAETSATPTAPCAVTAKVQKPYVYKSVEEGYDLNGAVLPTVTTVNTYNTSGDPSNIAVTTSGTALGLSQTSTKNTANLYFADNMAGDSWILGRLQRSTQTNSVNNSLASITTLPGVQMVPGAKGNLAGLTLTNIPVGTLGYAPVVLINTGSISLDVQPSSASVVGSPFSLNVTTCPTSLAPGASCQIVARYLPISAGTFTGSASVVTSAGTLTATLTLTAIAIQGTFTLTSGTLSGPASIAVFTNTGSGTITGISGSCQNSNIGPVSVSSTSVAPGAQVSVTGISKLSSSSGPPPNAGYCKAVISGANATNSPYVSSTY